MNFRRSLLLPAAAAVLAGCGGLNEAMTAHTDVVARAAGTELLVDDAVELLMLDPNIPADPGTVQLLADAYVDYALLATAVAEDTTLSAVDLDAFTRPFRDQAVVMKLREQVIRPDTVLTEADLDEAWLAEGPGVEVQARHILLRIPAEATPAQRDSVRELAESLRQRALAGEDFEQLATEYSQDPGSAARGGDLGFFGRGRMVAPFEEAAFALEPGETSEVVESPFGFHVIRVVDRRQPALEPEQRGEFRQFLLQRRVQEAQQEFLDSLSAAANVQVQPGGIAVAREIATRPQVRLRGRQAERAIATYEGGEYTAQEFVDFIRTQPAQVQTAFASFPDERIEDALQQLVRGELLLQEAERRDLALTRAEADSIRTEARGAVQQLVRQTGLAAPAAGPARGEAVKQRVLQLLRQALTGQADLAPLGRLSFVLRDVYPAEINEGTFPRVVEQVEELRAAQPAPALGTPGVQQPGVPQPVQPMPQPQPADTM